MEKHDEENSVPSSIGQKEEMIRAINEEVTKMKVSSRDRVSRIFESEKVLLALEARLDELKKREKEIEERQARLEDERLTVEERLRNDTPILKPRL